MLYKYFTIKKHYPHENLINILNLDFGSTLCVHNINYSQKVVYLRGLLVGHDVFQNQPIVLF